MVDNFNIGNKFDAAWKAAQQQLIKDGNAKPTTQDILHYLIDKWRPENNQSEQIVVQGFHLEHDSTPSLKYGVNIGCKPQLILQDTVPKYGANVGCQPDVDVPEPMMKYGANADCGPKIHIQDAVPKYGANAGCQPDVDVPEPMMKYGANADCGPKIHIQDTVPKYGANAGCQPDVDVPPPVTKYGANIGCGERTLKINADSLEVILNRVNSGINTLKTGTLVSYDRTTGTLHIKKDKDN